MNFNYGSRLCVFTILAGSCCSSSAQVTVPPEYTDEGGTAVNSATGAMKIGYFLETPFKTYFTTCANEQIKLKDGTPATSIPVPILQNGLPVWDWVRRPRDYSIGKGFAALVDGSDLNNADLPMDVTDANRLPINPLQDPSTMISEGDSAVAYSANCTAILAAALSADASVNFGFGNFSSMVQSDYSNNDSAELGMIQGRFSNPFLALYNPLIAGVDGAAYGHFLLWEWYRNKYSKLAAIPTDKLAALSWFRGYSLYRVGKQQRSLNGSITIKGSASYLSFVKGSGELDASYKNYGFANVTSFLFAIKDQTTGADSRNYEFVALDEPHTVAEWLVRSATIKSLPGSLPVLSKGQEIRQKQFIIGVPRSLCESDVWSVVPSVPQNTGTIRLSNHSGTDLSDANLPVCTFEVAFIPDDSLFAGAAAKNVPLAYSLESSIANQKLDLMAETRTYRTSNLPALAADSTDPYPFKPTPGVGGANLSWVLTISILEDPKQPLDYSVNPSPMADFALTGCKPVAGALSAALTAPTISGHKLQFTISEFIRTAATFDPGAKDNTVCGINGTLQFQDKAGNLVPISLPSTVVLSYPNPPGRGFLPGTLVRLPR